MKKKNPRTCIRWAAMLLAIVLALPMGFRTAKAEAVQPRDSNFINRWYAYVSPVGDGKIEVWFELYATEQMDALGCMSMALYESTDNENWSWLQTYNNVTNPELMNYYDYYHSGHIDYQGVAGRYYRAYVVIWAGVDEYGDSRQDYTESERAT